MQLDQLANGLQNGQVHNINIITHSGLNRYAVQVLCVGTAPALLLDKNRRPRFWTSLSQVQSALRSHGVVPPGLKVTVAQDEMIGR